MCLNDLETQAHPTKNILRVCTKRNTKNSLMPETQDELQKFSKSEMGNRLGNIFQGQE